MVACKRATGCERVAELLSISETEGADCGAVGGGVVGDEC